MMSVFGSSGGSQPDGTTIDTNAFSQLEVKPSVITQASSFNNITYTIDTTLTSDVYANNVTINPSVTVTTNGFNFYCAGTFTNGGTINTGSTGTAASSSSFGGSGGGSNATQTIAGVNGQSTMATGGAGGSTPWGLGGLGSSPTTPFLDYTEVSGAYTVGMMQFLIGAHGGNGVGTGHGNGGIGTYGIAIQANTIAAGTINAVGQDGTDGGNTGTGGGGGGGGSILLLFGTGGWSYNAFNQNGGSGGTCTILGHSNHSGAGGGGIVMLYDTTFTQPIPVTSSTDVTYASDTSLSADVIAHNVLIQGGVTVTTNGYNFYCSGTFTNSGIILTGDTLEDASWITNYPASYGGSGGGGAGGTTNNGEDGLDTTIDGGTGGTPSTDPTAGNDTSIPVLTSALIASWYATTPINSSYTNGMNDHLCSADGGNGSREVFIHIGLSGHGGISAGGIYIQADSIVVGTITSGGLGDQDGSGYSGGNHGGGGGGAGGAILMFIYGSGGYTAGTCVTNGGVGGTGNIGTHNVGAAGGDGQVVIKPYGPPPIPLNAFTYTMNSGINHKSSSYQYNELTNTSTNYSTAIAQTFTPIHSGLVRIKAVVVVSNHTIGDGILVGLFNGATQIDYDEHTQESIADNEHVIYLYNEQLFTVPSSPQTYSIQWKAITGGTAKIEIQEFTIEEEY